MANINDKFFADLAAGASWAAGVSFQRSNPLPLDKYSVFASITEAETYATTNAVAYPGQIVAVVNDGAMEVYVLAEKANEVAEGEEQTYSLALQEMGGKIEVDPNTLSTNSLGLLEILGFENAANLTLPQKKDGKVQWLPISEIAKGDGNDNTTYTFSLGADGKSIDIVTYENGVAVKGEDGNNLVQNIALTVYTKDETDDIIKTLSDRVTETKTAIENVFTKDETTKAIDDAVKSILGEDVSEAYDTLVEIQKLMEADDTASAELVGKVNANEEAIEKLNGADTVEGSVAKSIKDAIASENLSQYATKTELGDYAKSGDVADTYVTKTVANAENGLRFINQSEIDKLKALNLEGNEITISGSVNASQVKELYDTVINIVKGSTTDLNPDTPDSVETGLHIEEGAQVNKIEKVVFNGTEATIENKIATIAGEYYNKTEVDDKVKAASDAASAANTLAESAKNAADANAGTISATNETVAEHTRKLATIDQSITQHGSDISALQTTVNSHVTDIAQLKTDVQSASAAASANNTKIGELVAADESINTELSRLESAKANAADVYNKDSVYTKEQTDAAIINVTGTPDEGKTLVQMIADAKTAATYDDTKVKEDIKANADAIAILNQDVNTEGSIDYKVAQELAKILNDNDSSDIDTLNEIAAWIINDTTGAAKMNADIVANKAAIDKLNGTAETEGSVLSMIAAATPIATTEKTGLVKSVLSTVENGVTVAEDGTMSVNSININKLVQTEGDELILNGGTAL